METAWLARLRSRWETSRDSRQLVSGDSGPELVRAQCPRCREVTLTATTEDGFFLCPGCRQGLRTPDGLSGSVSGSGGRAGGRMGRRGFLGALGAATMAMAAPWEPARVYSMPPRWVWTPYVPLVVTRRGMFDGWRRSTPG